MIGPLLPSSWMTKPTDRFMLRWIKVHLCARITPRLLSIGWLRPWMITLAAAVLGALGGVLLALGWGCAAGLSILFSQILDGVDGQHARLTGRESAGGAFLDSVLDRYAEGAIVMGLVVYVIRLPSGIPGWFLIFFGSLAVIGSSLISYTSARAEALGIPLGKPTLASKGTRTTVTAVCAVGSLVWPSLPMVALGYLVVHPNGVVLWRLFRACRKADAGAQSDHPHDVAGST